MCLNFGILNRPEKNSNLTQFIFGFRAFREDKHCTAGSKTGFRGLDIRLRQLNSNTIIKAVVSVLSKTDLILISQILMANFAAVILQCEKLLHC